MEVILNNVKKHLRNGKIAFAVIAFAFAIGGFFLYYFLIQKLDATLALFTTVPVIAVSVSVSLIVWRVTISQVEKESGYYSLTRFNDNTTIEQRRSFIDKFNDILENDAKLGKAFLTLSIIGAIVVIILVLFVVDDEWPLPIRSIRAIYAVLYDIGTVFCMIIAYTGIFKDHIPTINHCPKCYSFYAFNSPNKVFDGVERSKEDKWEDHYGETGGVYVGGEKVGSVHGYTGSTRYEREVTEYKYKIITTCKYCNYEIEKSTSEYSYGAWK